MVLMKDNFYEYRDRTKTHLEEQEVQNIGAKI